MRGPRPETAWQGGFGLAMWTGHGVRQMTRGRQVRALEAVLLRGHSGGLGIGMSQLVEPA